MSMRYSTSVNMQTAACCFFVFGAALVCVRIHYYKLGKNNSALSQKSSFLKAILVPCALDQGQSGSSWAF